MDQCETGASSGPTAGHSRNWVKLTWPRGQMQAPVKRAPDVDGERAKGQRAPGVFLDQRAAIYWAVAGSRARLLRVVLGWMRVGRRPVAHQSRSGEAASIPSARA